MHHFKQILRSKAFVWLVVGLWLPNAEVLGAIAQMKAAAAAVAAAKAASIATPANQDGEGQDKSAPDEIDQKVKAAEDRRAKKDQADRDDVAAKQSSADEYAKKIHAAELKKLLATSK